jgi:DNA modification methylase
MKLILGDCLEKMKELPDESVDAIITDPPYGIEFLSQAHSMSCHRRTHRTRRNRKQWQKRIQNDSWDDFEKTLRAFFKEARRVLKDCGVVVTCCGGGGRTPSLPKLTFMGMEELSLCTTCVWSKGKTDGSFAGLGWTYRPSWEGAIVFFKGDHPNFYRNPQSNIFVHRPVIPRRGEHPTPKPVALMEFFILNHTKEGDVVLDPFMGGGTTGVACIKHKRDFIGIEIDEGFFHLAKVRIENWKGQVHLGDFEHEP